MRYRAAIIVTLFFMAFSPAHAGTTVSKSHGDGAETVLVKGGCFEMGDSFAEGEANERPVHTVCLSDFYMGKFSVTRGEFRDFADDTGYRTDAEKSGGCYVLSDNGWVKDGLKSWKYPGYAQGDDEPAVCVSWNDANEYIGWKSGKDKRNYRLPTEAEREYAARSRGKRYRYGWGDGQPSGNIADEAYRRMYGSGDIWAGYDDDYVFTSPVGSFSPNELGLYDITGNVWEWTADRYDEGYYKKSPRDNPKGPEEGNYRVIRGGSWDTVPYGLRTTARDAGEPDEGNFFIGFRLAASPE